MDFFTATAGTDTQAAVSSPTLLSTTVQNEDTTTTDAFAEAINARYSRKGSNLLIPLSPAASPASTSQPSQSSFDISLRVKPNPPPSQPMSSSSAADNFTPVLPAALHDVLNDSLVIDIRPHNAYSLARLPHALSLSVPSTLLKRPGFPLDRLAQMLSSQQAQQVFAKWPEASRILVYDADSPALNDGGNLLGLMRKFRKEGYTRPVFWLKGGFKTLWRERRNLVDEQQIVEEEDPSASGPTMPAVVLRTKALPNSAFTSSSTTSSRQIPPTPMIGRGSVDPFSLRLSQVSSGATDLSLTSASGSAALFSRSSTLALQLQLPSKTSTIPEGRTMLSFPPPQPNIDVTDVSSLPTNGVNVAYDTLPRPFHKSLPGGHSVAFNPFFDNIRQNIELSGGRGSGDGIPLRLPKRVRRRVGELPFEWLREICRKSGSLLDESEESEAKEEIDSMAETDDDVGNAVRHVAGQIAVPTARTSRRAERPKQRRSKNTVRRKRLASMVSTGSQSPPPDSSSVSASASASKTTSKAGSASPPPNSNAISPVSHSPSPTSQLPLKPDSPPRQVLANTTEASDSDSSGENLAKTLAMQFYKIELGEQRRLMGVMEHHSKESTTSASSSSTAHPARPAHGGYTGINVLPGSQSTDPPQALANSLSDSSSGSTVTVRPGSGCFLPPMPNVVSGSSDGVTTQNIFPYSITAGVEKGEKNRYRNIWPFEHARVRLQKTRPEDDDYMNASYVQPLGTRKRYIATQGPLPATFNDFWTLCWQENVHVIVMLTREVESALIKCGNYWEEGDYGPLHLTLISTTDTPEREKKRKESEMSSGFFNFPQVPIAKKITESEEDRIIRRVFQLTNSKYPDAPPRKVLQLQYLDWPDLDVPKNPTGLLQLIQEVDEAVDNARARGDRQWGEGPLRKTTRSVTPPQAPSYSSQSPPASRTSLDEVDPITGISKHAVGRAPVLLHCSAGVGRTGGFIAVDAILDGVRRELRKRREEAMKGSRRSSSHSDASRSPLSTPEDEVMDVDRSSASPVDDGQASGLTLPMSIRGNEVHVPVAGLSEDQAPMEVDRNYLESTSGSDADTKAPKQGNFKASPSLLNELKDAHLRSVSTSIAHHDPSSASPSPGPVDPRTASLKAQATARSSSNSAISSSGTSGTRWTNSGYGDSVAVSSRTSLSNASGGGQVRGVGHHNLVSQSMNNTEATAAERKENAARMDSWRTAVSDTQTHLSIEPKTASVQPSSLQAPKQVQDTVLASPRGMAFDYLHPRRLHGDASPPLLSTYDEPVRRVIEDMREQRMSLCQSLRQYVFVHRAIIEGALDIIDEEKRQEQELQTSRMTAGKDVEMFVGAGVEAADTLTQPIPFPRSYSFGHSTEVPKLSNSPVSPTPVRALGLDRVENNGLGPAFILEERATQSPLSQVVTVDDPMDGFGPSSPLSPRAKRQASPTELVNESIMGERRLTKRASVKRRPMAPAVEDEDVSSSGEIKLGSLALSSPPASSAR